MLLNHINSKTFKVIIAIIYLYTFLACSDSNSQELEYMGHVLGEVKLKQNDIATESKTERFTYIRPIHDQRVILTYNSNDRLESIQANELSPTEASELLLQVKNSFRDRLHSRNVRGDCTEFSLINDEITIRLVICELDDFASSFSITKIE